MNIITFAQICGGFLFIVNKFFLLFITSSISLSYKAKINLALLFSLKNLVNQYMSRKKYGMHLGLSGPFDFVYLQYSSPVRKMHSPSARTSSPTTRTPISTLGLKRPTLRPKYIIHYIFGRALYCFMQ